MDEEISKAQSLVRPRKIVWDLKTSTTFSTISLKRTLLDEFLETMADGITMLAALSNGDTRIGRISVRDGYLYYGPSNKIVSFHVILFWLY